MTAGACGSGRRGRRQHGRAARGPGAGRPRGVGRRARAGAPARQRSRRAGACRRAGTCTCSCRPGSTCCATGSPASRTSSSRHGAVRVDGTGAWVYQGGAYRARGDWGRPRSAQTRPLLEHVVRSRVAALPGRHRRGRRDRRGGHAVGWRRVTGVVVDGRGTTGGPRRRLLRVAARASPTTSRRRTVLDPPVTRSASTSATRPSSMRRSPGRLRGHTSSSCIENPGSFRGGRGRARRGRPLAGDARPASTATCPRRPTTGSRRFAATLPTPGRGAAHQRTASGSPTSRPTASRRASAGTTRRCDALLPGLVTAR